MNPSQQRTNPILRMGTVNTVNLGQSKQPIFEFGITSTGNLAITVGTTVVSATSGTIAPNQLTHVAVTINGTAVQFYVNGESLASNSGLPENLVIVGNELELEIGRNLSNAYFAGQIRDVRLWNRVRTVEQIRQTLHQFNFGRANGLIGYWPLNQISANTTATIARDFSFNQNHLMLGGIPEEFNPDRIIMDQPLLPSLPIAVSGTVLELDGENDVVVIRNPANTGLGHYERLTLELWFSPLNLTQRNPQRQILYSQGDAKAGLSAYLFESRLHIITWCEDETQKIHETLLRSEPLSDQWHHLAITNDTTRSRHFVEFRAYLNGNELAFVSSDHPNNANLENYQKGYLLSRTGAAYLGGIGEQGISRFAGEFNTERQHYFAGQVTDLRLWNRVKTRDEIDADRHTAPTLSDPNLIAYLPMDEGTGNVLHDRSQTGNHYEGTLQSRNLVFLTDSTDLAFEQLYSYYNPTNGSTNESGTNSASGNVLSWTNYAYTGRIYLPAQFDRMGVTVLSRRPENRDRDYRLQWQRSGDQVTVQLVATGGQPLIVTIPAGNSAGNSLATIPASQTDRWYRFRIEVENNTGENRTDIRARVWQEDTEEPQTFPLIAQDNSPTRISSGTVGVWTTRSAGTKQFDDLQVVSLFSNPIPTVLLAETFDPYKLNENPSGWVEVGDRRTTVLPEVLLDENFESYNDNQDPRDWRDTSENYSLTINENLFKTGQVARNKIFRTTSSANHIHSHYVATGTSRWSNYVYSGRLLVPDISTSGIGVTVLSQYPNADGYYRLGRLGGVQTAPNQARFHLSVRRTPGSPSNSMLDGQVDSGITPRPNTWYRFRIEVEDEGDRTRIRAKIWEDGTPEPQTYSMNATDQAIDRFRAGTVGLWAAGNGEKRFDDLRVQRLETTRFESVVDDRLFRTADAQDNTARWPTISTYPLLLRPLNRRALRFNGQTEYLAANNLKGLSGNQFTIVTWINPAQRQSDSGQPNPVFSWQDGTSSRFFWFGITATGNLTLFAEQPGNIAATGGIVGSTPIPVGQFTHIAVSVNGNSVTFFINGNPETTQTFPVALSFNPTTLQVGRFFNTYLVGELLDLRLWNTARTTANLAIEHRYQQPDLSSSDLVGYWSLSESDGELALDTSVNANHLRLGGIAGERQPRLPGGSPAALVPVPNPLTLDDTTLQGLATLRQLQARHDLPIDRLTSLWFEIRHTGRADGQTLFDRIFNGSGIMGDPWTSLQYPIDWTVTGQNRSDRQVRSRLMGALQVSSSDLDLLVQRLSGATIVIELDSQYLTRLYRLAQLAKVLRLTVQDFLRLLELMNLTDVNTLETFKQVSDRADWMQRTGLQVSELEFLTHSTLNSQISLPYTEAAIRDLATTLTNQSSEFLVTHSSFVSDLVNLAQSMQIFDVLSSSGILDERGAVSLQDQPPVRLTGINGLPSDPAVLQAIQSQVEETLLRMQQEQANAIVERLAELFQVEPERLQIVHNHLRNHLNVTSSLFLGWMRDIVDVTDSQPIPVTVRDYLNQLSRGLYLIDRFALTTNEAAHLLNNPDNFSVTSIFNSTIADLEHLVMFTELKSAFNDVNGGLIHVFNQATDSAIETAILNVTDWELEQFRTLTNYFGNSSTANRIPQLHRLYRAFALADTLQVNIEFLIQLANTENLTIDFYWQQSAALLNVVRSRYDDDQWQRVYKPIRDRLVTQKRDALLSYALTRQLPADFPGRRDADVLYEYLLLDVQIGSEVETSRIAQGISALQLYVQRCQLNLEQGVDPATIPADQWNWMKNYRVWEANRKVFLYPESYIEPELRDTKTPLFEELELELMQGEINQANVEKALNNYLNKLAELADLKIVGSYLHRDDTTQAQTLYLIGRTNSQPRTYYYRELVVNENRWLPWKQIDLPINAEFVSPVFAFNRLFLFWVEFTEVSRQNPRSQANRTVYQPLIQFSYPDFNGAWVPPQPYAQDHRALEANERSRPEWQRVYALRTERAIPVISTAGNGAAPETRERILVVYGDMNRVNAAVEVRTLRNARDQEAFTLQLNGSAQNSSDLRLSPQFIGQLPRFLGHMTVSNLERLNQIAAGNTANRGQLRDVLNNLFDRPQRRIGLSQRLIDELPLNFTDNFQVERGSNHWAIVEGGARVVVRQMGDRLNVYQTSWFLGFMNLAFLSILDNLADRTADAAEIAQLRSALNQLFDRSVDVQINVPENVNFRVDKLRDTQWIVAYGNGQSQTERLLIWQANDRLDVYSFSTDFLSSFLNTFSSIKLGSNVRLDVLENNQLLFTDNDRDGSHQEYLLVPSNRESFDVYRRSTASLYTASINAPGINEYTLALAPNQAPTSTPQPILNQLPLEASLLDVNNQPGWYIVDTGEEQFLLQAAIITTDADRLQFTAQSPRTQLSFQAAPLPQTVQFNTLRLDTTAVRELSLTLFQQGIDGLLSLRSQQIQERRFANYRPNSQVTSLPSDVLDFNGAFGLYYQEIFFYIPFFIANQLNANQDFAGAQRWYHYIFNPTSQESANGSVNESTSNCPIEQDYLTVLPNRNRYWQYLPFRNRCVDSIARILDPQNLEYQAALVAYRNDPFDPHTIAQLRVNAYQKAIVMKYIDNLLDWGDFLFNQNNRESIGEAAQLYVLAYNLLGSRPEGRATRKFEEIGDYNAIRQVFDTPPDFLTEFPRNGALPVPQNGNILTTFCVTENADFVGFWDRVSDRLFKIRHSLNIDGVFRQLDLFQPPLDVRALVAAFASGNRDLSSILADVNRPVPHYRYGYMLDKAKEMTEIVIGLGEKLLEAIQNRDAEQLATLQNTHERTILDLMTATRQAEIEVVQQEIEALIISKRGIENRQMYYGNLVSGGTAGLALNGGETTDLLFTSFALSATAGQSFLKFLGAFTAGIEAIAPLSTASKATPFDLAGDGAGALADGLAYSAQLAEKLVPMNAA
ncbi:MAG: LamG domain-containing protein [Cyanobacteria bacterium CRU_2_1]|nr:LamG domain-containing protein [Cyanobacteria bacterium CRU_2_1]